MQHNTVVVPAGAQAGGKESRPQRVVLEDRSVGFGRFRGRYTKTRIFRAGAPADPDPAKLRQGGGRQI